MSHDAIAHHAILDAMNNHTTPNNCEQTISRVIWGFIIGYIGIYAFAILVGFLCAGGMLLIGFLLAALR
jgi:hypothetical protein